MKKQKKLPYIFLFILVIILIFVIGTRYGQSVERTNKVINFIMSITPTKAITPTPMPTITYLTYTQKGCGLAFLYPSTMTVVTESTSAAQLHSLTDYIEINCDTAVTPSIQKPQLETQTATESVTFDKKTITAVVKTIQFGSNTIAVFEFIVKNPLNNKSIVLKINKQLLPIFERTVQYSK